MTPLRWDRVKVWVCVDADGEMTFRGTESDCAWWEETDIPGGHSPDCGPMVLTVDQGPSINERIEMSGRYETERERRVVEGWYKIEMYVIGLEEPPEDLLKFRTWFNEKVTVVDDLVVRPAD